MKEWEEVGTPRKGGKGWEDGAPMGRTEGRRENVELPGSHPQVVPTLKECVDLNSALISKQMHGMA